MHQVGSSTDSAGYRSSAGGASAKGPKHFEAKWIREKDFRHTVEQAWASAGLANSGGVLSKLGRMHEALHAWDRSILKKPKSRLRNAQEKLENAMNGPLTEGNENLAKEMASLVELLLEQEEIHWFQCSRSNWLQFGDRNTSFFHHCASARRKKNYIKKLLNVDNDWVEGTAALKPLVLDYFSNLFSSEVHAINPIMIEKVQLRVSDVMNEKLTATFSVDDVKKAIFSIGDFKAPGPDGLHVVFYKQF
jgi:hypothetical protein